MNTNREDVLVCPICGGEALRKQLRLSTSNTIIYECVRCKHRFAGIHEQTFERIESLYSSEYYGFRDDPVFRQVIRDELKSTFSSRIPQGRILDVGCGNGIFLDEAKKLGYEVLGIDLSTSAVQICKQRGVPVKFGDFTKVQFDGRFDFITMWDVIEHLTSPFIYVQRAYELLKHGGYLVIKTPNIGSLTIRVSFQPRLAAVLLQFPAHTQFFTRTSIQWLLDSTDFRTYDWLPGRSMRGKRPIRTLRGLIGRLLRIGVKIFTQNGNFYVIAQK